VTREAEAQANVQACIDRFGRLDALCNIAGIILLQHFQKITVEQFRRVLEVNLVGTLHPLPGGAAPSARGPRCDRQYVFDVSPRGPALRCGVRHEQGRGQRADAHARRRVRQAGGCAATR
jgi:NAD(P)-dependent dehydrogenase (short-subunit alcohol dehydrogenase family)